MIAVVLAAFLATTPDLGPLKPGMDLGAASSSIQGLGVRRSASGKVIALELRKAEVLGRPTTVTLRDTGHSSQTLNLFWYEENVSRQKCQATFIEFATVVEASYGPMRPGLFRAQGPEILDYALAGVSVWPIDAVNAVIGDGAHAPNGRILKFSHSRAAENDTGSGWTAVSRADPATGRFFDTLVNGSSVSSGARPSRCSVSVTIRATPPGMPLLERVKDQAYTAPSIAKLNYALRPLSSGETVHGTVDCLVRRRSGQAAVCKARNQSLPFSDIAVGMAKDMVFRQDGTVPDDGIPLVVEVAINTAPTDRRDIVPPRDPLPELGKPTWVAKPSLNQVQRFSPRRGDELQQDARGTALCQIQSDGSLICPSISSTAPGFGIEQATERILLEFQAGQLLQDGKPSEGAWVRVSIGFDAG